MKTYFTFMKESHTLYHKSYTDAINAALAHHKDKEGLNVSDEDRDTHIAMGPRKPAEGETVEHHIPATDKNGKRRIIHIQVYNKGGPTPFELNAYSSGDKVAEETVDVSEVLGDVRPRAVYTNKTIGDFSGLKAHAKKLGPEHKDYDDLMIAASHMAFGNKDHLNKHIEKLDTDVRDKIKKYMKEKADQIDEAAVPPNHKQALINHYGPGKVTINKKDGMISHTGNGETNSHAYDPNEKQPIGHHVGTVTVAEEIDQIDEQVSFKKTISGHQIHHKGKPVGKIIKTNSMGGLGYSVRIGDDEVSSERSLDAAKESAKYHLTSLKEQEELDEMRNDAVTQFASQAHDVWRSGFDPEGTGKERIKKNSDGSEGNINVPFKKLHPDWQKENLSAGKAALQAVRKHPNDMESAADHVHKEWMKRNPKADYNAHLHVPYSELPEVEKQKDRNHVDTMKSLLGKKQQKIKPLAEISAALARRASRLAMDK